VKASWTPELRSRRRSIPEQAREGLREQHLLLVLSITLSDPVLIHAAVDIIKLIILRERA
jgi:hypothetical protein